ncbi:MAG TPA: hypothetical protein VII98_12430 [Solirubrobacteraceae bacterium]
MVAPRKRRSWAATVAAALLVAVVCSLPAGAGAAPPTVKRCAKGFVRKHGRCVCPKTKVRHGKRCVARKKTTPTTGTPTTPAPTPGTPTTPAPSPPAAADGPPFSPPGHDITGATAAKAILPFLANSTFTDCVTGFPTCSYEERYGHFADGTMYYCRLTPTSGSDIINAGHAFQIIGADQKADGSWAVTLQIASYDNQSTYYTWSVTTTGVATGLYWGPGSNPQTDPATQSLGPLRWVRGARNCSY